MLVGVNQVMVRGGSGSFDRNISPRLLEQVVAALHTRATTCDAPPDILESRNHA